MMSRWMLALFLCQAQTLAGQNLKPVFEPRNAVVDESLEIAKDLEQEKLLYSNQGADYRDCSGIFHQLLDRLEASCPNFKRPDRAAYRTTQGIAQWYSDQSYFQVVGDALKQNDLLEPGTILFFGEQNKKYGRLSESEAQSKLSHLGLVDSETRNSAGEVENYNLFHGRSSGKVASVTYHGRKPSNQKHPPLGNGNQQWIGTADLCQGASCACSPQSEHMQQ